MLKCIFRHTIPAYYYPIGCKHLKQLLGFILFALTTQCQAQSLGVRTVTLMGSRWDITIVASDSTQAEKYIDTVVAEVTRIE